jgi:hypothetical protein
MAGKDKIPDVAGQPSGSFLDYRPPGLDRKKDNPLCLISLVFGLVALTSAWAPPWVSFYSIVGVILAIIGLRQIKRQPERYAGRMMGWVGLGFSFAAIVISWVVFVLYWWDKYWPD